MLREMVQQSYLILVADITLLVFILFNSTLSDKRRNGFLAGALIALLMVISNIAKYMCDGNTAYLPILKLASATSFAISGPVILPFVFLSNVIHERMCRLFYVAAFLNALASYISMFTEWYYYYDDAAISYYGKFSAIPYFLTGMYLAVLIAASFIKFRIGMHREGAFIMLLSLFVIIATTLNTAFGFKFLVSGMAVLCGVFYYLFFTTETLTRDALTDLLNRHVFYKDVERMKRQRMIVISMDLNGLKRINDTIGHDAGDKAILAVAEAMRENVPVRCRCYRMGGDEFEILYPGAELSDAEKLADALKSAVAAKSYSVAVGYKEYRKDMDFDALFREADAMMYEDKVRMKGVRTD